LPARATLQEIVRYFPVAHAARVDLAELPPAERSSLILARLPELPEALLLDRVLQLLPPMLAGAADRILIVDSGVAGQLGSYRAGIIRLFVAALLHFGREPQLVQGACDLLEILGFL
jgi:hypothetical protein